MIDNECYLCGNKPKFIYRVGGDKICGACCAAQLAEARQENAKLRRELEAANVEIGDLEDCRESLRKLGEYCGCDHVECSDERQMQVQHIHEAFYAKEQENAKLRSSVDNLGTMIRRLVHGYDIPESFKEIALDLVARLCTKPSVLREGDKRE